MAEKMKMMENLKEKREELFKIAEKYGVENIRVFGSVVRGEETPKSDIDFLIRMKKGKDLFDLGGFQYDATELLGRRVDVVLEGGIYHMLKERILNEAKPL